MKNISIPLSFLVAACQLLLGAARADVLLDSTSLIGTPTVAPPSEYSFTASTAQALTLTLTDFRAPATFVSLQVAVTLGDALVGSASIDPATHVATLAIPAATGNYTLHVIGIPDTTQGLGTFGVCVAPAGAAANCIASDSFSGNIQTPTTPSSTSSSALNTTFMSTTVAGVYTVTITDDAFPAALQTVSGGVALGSAPVNTTGFVLGANQVTLAPSTSYNLVIAAVADANVSAGLYSIHIADPSGAAVFDRTLPVGTLAASSSVNNPTAQTLNLTVSDLMYPAPLARVGVAVTAGSTLLAELTAPGTVASGAAPVGTLQVWQYAVEGAQPGVYSANLSNAADAGTVFSTTKVVNPSATSGQSFAFVENLTAAGTYNLAVTDFNFPSALQSLSATVAQNGNVLTQSSTGAFSAAAGPIVVLVGAAAATGGSGIFDVSIQTSAAAPQILFDQTQYVGGVFTTQPITLGISGSFDVTLTDLGFPAHFQDLAVVVSQGSQILGKAYGGGVFTVAATPGTYMVTIVDTPNSTASYGLYSIKVASSAPTVTFASSASSVSAGSAVTLTWSSNNATACTAAGGTGWAGSQATSGTLSLVVSATETLTLTCTGAGGSASQSATVTATAPASKSGGGGGGLDVGLLAALGALTLGRRAR
jgi:plastocyanin